MNSERSPRPVIEILLALYEPRLDWLAELLDSLNAQTWHNILLRVEDDASPTADISAVEALLRERISAFPYVFTRSEVNRGSNTVFAELTAAAEAEYIAYCDQDDVWLPEKLTELMAAMESENALLVCSDMSVIDGSGRLIADSITQVRRHFVFPEGDGRAEELILRNFASGCTILVRSDAAKSALPFCPHMVYDHYLTLWCAEHGRVIALRKGLIRYRIHGGNQTGVLSGVTDKASYHAVRIRSLDERLRWLAENFPCSEETGATIGEMSEWVRARDANWRSGRGRRRLIALRRFAPAVTLFELFAPRMPEKLFAWFIKLAKKNVL